MNPWHIVLDSVLTLLALISFVFMTLLYRKTKSKGFLYIAIAMGYLAATAALKAISLALSNDGNAFRQDQLALPVYILTAIGVIWVWVDLEKFISRSRERPKNEE